MWNFIKELATDVMLTCAAVIGAVLFSAVAAGILQQPAAAPQATPTHRNTHVVSCLEFLSHRAMVLNQVDHVGPTPAASFCIVPSTEA